MTDKADAALAAQDAAAERMIEDYLKAEEDEGAQWRQRQEADDATVAAEKTEDLGPEVGDWHPGLPIGSEADCGKAIAWLAACRREMNEVERRKQQAIETATKWAHDRLHGVMGLKTRHDGQEAKILDYAQKHPEVFGGKKTAKFPGGSIKQRERKEGYWKKNGDALSAEDLLGWAEAAEKTGAADLIGRPLVLRQENRTVDVLAVREYAARTGDCPAGMTFVSAGVDYSVKTGES